MNSARIVVFLSAVLVPATAKFGTADDAGNSNGNPFSRAAAADSQRMHDHSNERPARSAARSPRASWARSVWHRMRYGTAQMFHKTTSLLTFWRRPETAHTQPRPTGTRNIYPGGTNRRATTPASHQAGESPFSFTSMFHREKKDEEIRPPETVNDFLSLPRVPYE